jgi:hypothetical protein
MTPMCTKCLLFSQHSWALHLAENLSIFPKTLKGLFRDKKLLLFQFLWQASACNKDDCAGNSHLGDINLCLKK